jgi:hypothetical protein
MIEFSLGIIILILDIWAIVQTVQSSASTSTKIIWTLVLIFLPVVGLILWLLFGPRRTATAS